MIMIHPYIVLEGGIIYNPKKIIKKFPEKTQFNFDVESYSEWKNFLRTLKLEINGEIEFLPRYSKRKFPNKKIAYRVYNFSGKYCEFFPGKGQDTDNIIYGKKPKEIKEKIKLMTHGVL